jgi:hypothetical protein
MVPYVITCYLQGNAISLIRKFVIANSQIDDFQMKIAIRFIIATVLDSTCNAFFIADFAFLLGQGSPAGLKVLLPVFEIIEYSRMKYAHCHTQVVNKSCCLTSSSVVPFYKQYIN